MALLMLQTDGGAALTGAHGAAASGEPSEITWVSGADERAKLCSDFYRAAEASHPHTAQGSTLPRRGATPPNASLFTRLICGYIPTSSDIIIALPWNMARMKGFHSF